MPKKKNNNTIRVSLCTPTFNRRPFIKQMIANIDRQTYPKELMEWIIVDDGTDCIKDLIPENSIIKYFYCEEKMSLGKKRNYMHEKCSFKNDNDILIYIDDDDFYPPERVSHAVEKLTKSKDALCAGSSELCLWFNELNKMYKFGPYGKNHATAGTFAFKRKLLKDTSYQDDALLAEEKHFLKNYTVPFVQLDSLKTILVVSHTQNTFDKKRLISKDNKFCNESSLKPSNFIKDKESCDFYTEKLDALLKNYSEGDVKNKPGILEEIKRRDNERQVNKKEVSINQSDGTKKVLNEQEIIQLLELRTKQNEELKQNINLLNKTNKELKEKNEELTSKNEELTKKITESDNFKKIVDLLIEQKNEMTLLNEKVSKL